MWFISFVCALYFSPERAVNFCWCDWLLHYCMCFTAVVHTHWAQLSENKWNKHNHFDSITSWWWLVRLTWSACNGKHPTTVSIQGGVLLLSSSTACVCACAYVQSAFYWPVPPSPWVQGGPQFPGRGPSWRTCDSPGKGFLLRPALVWVHGCLSVVLQRLHTDQRKT